MRNRLEVIYLQIIKKENASNQKTHPEIMINYKLFNLNNSQYDVAQWLKQ